ncbi:MAG TPA: phosphate ABC transporter permease subunit PstC [Lachnospiraceae bacterium]|nr:phosphate ABC transporter permease subunit PstC [Lachnospiraceae bacterium]
MDFEKRRKAAEAAARIFFFICAALTVLAVAAVIFYMICMGLPALGQLGLKEIFFGTRWKPTAAEPEFGIFYIILTSLLGTVLAAAVGVPLGILTAVYLAELADEKRAGLVRAAVEVLAGIPSVIYGLLGIYILNPVIYRLERKLFAGSESHSFTGGANLISAVIVLAVMMLPTVIHISETSIRAVRPGIREASLALGADRVQTIFRSVLPAARPGILAAVILGVGRAAGEAMAITLVSGGSVNAPFPFYSVRFLTTAVVSEMGYAQGLHRQMLFTIALVLLGFILLVNGTAKLILGKGAEKYGTDRTEGAG